MLARGIFVDLAPSALRVEATPSGNHLTWTNNSDVTGTIQVMRGTTLLATLPRAATSYVDAAPAGTWIYQVRSVNIDDPSSVLASEAFTLTNGAAAAPSTATSGNAAGGSSGGGCFIATAAYGTSTEPHVMTLREFRDRRLLTNTPGRWFVATYYRLSPPVADWIRERPWARTLVRLGLAPLIWAIEQPVACAVAMLLAVVVLIRWRRGAREALGTPAGASNRVRE